MRFIPLDHVANVYDKMSGNQSEEQQEIQDFWMFENCILNCMMLQVCKVNNLLIT